MTLEEKLGQLVQYGDSGYDGEVQTAAEVADAPWEESFDARQGRCRGSSLAMEHAEFRIAP